MINGVTHFKSDFDQMQIHSNNGQWCGPRNAIDWVSFETKLWSKINIQVSFNTALSMQIYWIECKKEPIFYINIRENIIRETEMCKIKWYFSCWKSFPFIFGILNYYLKGNKKLDHRPLEWQQLLFIGKMPIELWVNGENRSRSK